MFYFIYNSYNCGELRSEPSLLLDHNLILKLFVRLILQMFYSVFLRTVYSVLIIVTGQLQCGDHLAKAGMYIVC